MGMIISNMDEDTFLYKFNIEEDVRRILNGRLLMVMGQHMIVKKWFSDVRVEDIDFNSSLFWVRAYGIPLTMQCKRNYVKISNLIGQFMKVSLRDDGRHMCALGWRYMLPRLYTLVFL